MSKHRGRTGCPCINHSINRVKTSQCASTLHTRVYVYIAGLIKKDCLHVSNVRDLERKPHWGWLLKTCSVRLWPLQLYRWKNQAWRDGPMSKNTCSASTATTYKAGHAHTWTCKPSAWGRGMKSEGLPRLSDHRTSFNFSEKFCIKGIMWGWQRKTYNFLL